MLGVVESKLAPNESKFLYFSSSDNKKTKTFQQISGLTNPPSSGLW